MFFQKQIPLLQITDIYLYLLNSKYFIDKKNNNNNNNGKHNK